MISDKIIRQRHGFFKVRSIVNKSQSKEIKNIYFLYRKIINIRREKSNIKSVFKKNVSYKQTLLTKVS